MIHPTTAQKELWQALSTFEKSGEILPCLLKGFDQTGCWVGMDTEVGALKGKHPILEKFTLPEDRRTQQDQEGRTRLLTSYVQNPLLNIKGEKTIQPRLTIPYTSIDGRVILEMTTQVEMPNLQEIGDSLISLGVEVLIADKLERIGRDFKIRNLKSLSAPKLQEVKQNVEAYSIEHFELESLRSIGGNVNLATKTLTLPNLESVGGNFDEQTSHIVKLPKLRKVGKAFRVYAQELEIPRLKSVDLLSLGARKNLVIGKIKANTVIMDNIKNYPNATKMLKALATESLEILHDSTIIDVHHQDQTTANLKIWMAKELKNRTVASIIARNDLVLS